jgi:hypothetical protein
MRARIESGLNRNLVAADETAGWVDEPGVGTAAVVEIRRWEGVPRTGTG